MRRRYSFKPYLLIAMTLFILLALPKSFVESLRSGTISSLSLPFHALTIAKAFASEPLAKKIPNKHPSKKPRKLKLQEEIQRLELENQQLRTELSCFQEQQKNSSQQPFNAIPARVIFRSPTTWNSCLWVNVGEKDNRQAKKMIIAKNSPVLVGTSVVGIIDLVKETQSRVRLITDTTLTPSVRAVRKREDDAMWFLAKGELQGTSAPLWRSQGQTLKGIGFNYDFPDDHGPARDLYSGEAITAQEDFPTMPILQNGDLLITTGMDGVFPEGLKVARVTKIKPLKEGSYFYELEAKPTASDLLSLTVVFVTSPTHDKLPGR